jgi:hypothetical protein
VNDNKVQKALLSLKKLLFELENQLVDSRSRVASKKLSRMTEEERRMLSMAPKEKEFFLAYKLKHPENPWTYFKEYQKKLQKEYKVKQTV